LIRSNSDNPIVDIQFDPPVFAISSESLKKLFATAKFVEYKYINVPKAGYWRMHRKPKDVQYILETSVNPKFIPNGEKGRLL